MLEVWILDYKHLISRRPTLGKCPKCKAKILEGLDMGAAYRVTPIPVNLMGETIARLQGRATYWLLYGGQLAYRSLFEIGSEGPGKRRRPMVLADHICDPIDPTHIEQTRISEVSNLILKVPNSDDLTKRMMNALMVLAGELPGKVVSDDDRPPF